MGTVQRDRTAVLEDNVIYLSKNHSRIKFAMCTSQTFMILKEDAIDASEDHKILLAILQAVLC